MYETLFFVAIKQQSFNDNKTYSIKTSLYGRISAVVLIIYFDGNNIIIH